MDAIQLDAEWAPRTDDGPSTPGIAPRASSFWRNPRWTLQEIEDPTPGADEVVIAVGACGVCGSDTHCYETDDSGYVKFSGPARLPVVPGHEYAGEIVAVGSAVRSVRVGQHVAAEGMLYCGVCEACRRGLPNQCPNLRMTGFSAPGAFARHVAVPERHVWGLDAMVEEYGAKDAVEMGALIEPIACSFNGIWVAGPGLLPGSHVVVYGCGPIGLGAIALARAAGAASVLAFDTVPERLALARRCGADEAWSFAPGEASERVMAHTRGWGADLHVEAAGAADQTLPEIDRSVAPGATVVYLGRTGGCGAVPLDTLVSKAARLVGARGHAGGGCYPAIIRLMAAGRLDPRTMITGRFGLHDTVQAVARSVSRTDGKLLIKSQTDAISGG